VQASGSATGPATSTADTASALEGSATSLQLMVSTSDARTGAGHLNGQTVKGTVYVFTAEGANVTAPVRFFFDEEPDSTPSQVERNAPFDFKGGSANRANPWNTTDVADGTHRIVVVDAAGRRADASFTVENAVQSPAPTPTPTNPGLSFSVSSTRSSPGSLEGRTVEGIVYVFTRDGTNGTPPVRFFFDEEPDGTPYQVEQNAPFDFKGGNASLANPWDTRSTTDGRHRIVAVDAGGNRAEASFEVKNVAADDPAPTPSTDGLVLYRQDWEHPDSDGVNTQDWGFQCNNITDWYATRGSFTKVNSPVSQGAFAARFDLPADTVKPTACEMLHGRSIDHGKTDYYALSLRFPSGWREPSKAHWGMAIFQPNYQGIRSSAVGLYAHADHVALGINSGYCASECQYRSGNGAATGPLGYHYAIPRARFATDVWHEIIMRVRWTTVASSGIVEVFQRRRGESTWVRTAYITNIATLQWKDGYDATSNKWTTDKFGAYRGQADYPISVFHDSWCRATSFSAAQSCL
jgi:hypothetical protein